MPRYAIRIVEENFALIRLLNNDGEVAIEEKPTYFCFDINQTYEVENRTIEFEDSLYDKNGHLKTDIILKD